MEEDFPEEVNKICDMSDSIKFNFRDSSPSKPALRQITSSDEFPCYNCGNDRMLIRDCEVCNRTGFLLGSNPMVRLIQQIIDCKMKASSNCRQNDIRVSQNLTSSVTFPLSLHENFMCDDCGTDPIVGSRYHCERCGDYDLCESCYLKNRHPHTMTLAGEENHKKTALDRQTQRSTLMKSCRMSINRQSRQSRLQ